MKVLSFFVLVGFGMLLMYASTGLPTRGEIDAPVHLDISPAGSPVASSYYIRNAMKDANTPNIVTSVLGDYRSFDTLGEVVVILTAGICCSLILRKRKS